MKYTNDEYTVTISAEVSRRGIMILERLGFLDEFKQEAERRRAVNRARLDQFLTARKQRELT